jgi:hypothetical protein
MWEEGTPEMLSKRHISEGYQIHLAFSGTEGAGEPSILGDLLGSTGWLSRREFSTGWGRVPYSELVMDSYSVYIFIKFK